LITLFLWNFMKGDWHFSCLFWLLLIHFNLQHQLKLYFVRTISEIQMIFFIIFVFSWFECKPTSVRNFRRSVRYLPCLKKVLISKVDLAQNNIAWFSCFLTYLSNRMKWSLIKIDQKCSSLDLKMLGHLDTPHAHLVPEGLVWNVILL